MHPQFEIPNTTPVFSIYKQSMHSCQENEEWSGSGVEQKSGISQFLNQLRIDHVGF